jgi:gamma-glutamyltranspeptidase
MKVQKLFMMTIVGEMNALGGNWLLSNLKNYKVLEREPIVSTYRGHKVISAPVPYGGICLQFILNILENFNITQNIENRLHLLTEAMRFAFAYRTQLGDPDFVNVIEISNVMKSKEESLKLSRKITDKSHNFTYYFPNVTQHKDDHGTDHLSVLDSSGMAVSLTHTVNLAYGSGLVGPHTGIVYNDEMDDFSTNSTANQFGLPPSVPNFIRPGKRPLSSMSPSIVLDKNNKPFVIAGASGGPTIITATLQTIINCIDLKKDIREAIEYPRIHHQNQPNILLIEQNITKLVNVNLLVSKGYPVISIPDIACVNGIKVESNGAKTGWGDSRKQGKANGDKKRVKLS